MIHKKLLITGLLFFAAWHSHAQSQFYFTGYGRVLVANTKYDKSSEFMKGDTSSAKRKLAGDFVFDLGVNVKVSDQFKVNSIVRVTNQFGGFFSTGSALEFRQVQIQGILAKKVQYNIGDIDLGLTKYTLFNSYEPTYSEYEADAFKIWRSVVNYDNFNFGNKWRLQGAQANTAVDFKKGIERIDFNAFGTRIKPSNFLQTPDRLLYGGSVKIRQSRFLELGGNIVGVSDVAGTVQDTVVMYTNNVLTGNYMAAVSSRTLNFSAFGEVGRSFYNMNKVDDKVQVKKVDGFFDVGFKGAHRFRAYSLTASYRLVGPDFSSPGAQTRRLNDNAVPGLLPVGAKGTLVRDQTVFDRLSDINLYNRAISTTLMYFNPIYNNSTPYGQATPNRKGVTLDLNLGHRDSLLYANLNGQILSEVLGTGIKDKRKFAVFNGGATLNINKLLKTSKLFALSSSLRYEKTTGSKATKIDLTSMMLDLGLTIETISKLDVMGGIKMLNAKGTENLILRDEFNTISSFQLFQANVNQKVYTAGFRYRFTNYIYFAANGFFLSNADQLAESKSYKLRQFFFSYIMKF